MYTVPDKSRKPVDNPAIFQKWLDDGFKKVFGEPVRKRAVFCSIKHGVANDYGSLVYTIYPKNDFTFYYSDLINDIYNENWVYFIDVDTERNKDLLARFIDMSYNKR